MNFDFKKTLGLVKGGLFNPQATWNDYLATNPGWQQTAIVLTGPLIVLNVLLGLILSRIMGGYLAYGLHTNFVMALIMGLVLAVVGFLVAVFVFNFLAGVFKGNPNFDRAFAAVSLAAIPAWIAGIVGALIPGVGFLIALAGAIVTLVFLYKIMPLALGVPPDKRVVHFIVSIIAIFIVNVVLSMTFGTSAIRSEMEREGMIGERSSSAPAAAGSGFIGALERQGRLMEEAGQDTYVPPEDGKLSEEQVEDYAGVMRKTQAAHEQYNRKMEAIAEDIEAKEQAGETPSAGDLAKIYGGVGGALAANNAEMEIVKSAGGNWAEHQWVKEQLRIAQLQQGEGTEAIEHNYELYQEYADELPESY